MESGRETTAYVVITGNVGECILFSPVYQNRLPPLGQFGLDAFPIMGWQTWPQQELALENRNKATEIAQQQVRIYVLTIGIFGVYTRQGKTAGCSGVFKGRLLL